MKTRIYNAKILSMQEGAGLTEGEIRIEGDTITEILDQPHLASARPVSTPGAENSVWDREINAKGNLIIPGFKNAHTHSAMTFLRSYADDLPLQEWLQTQVFPMEAKLTPEHILWFSKLAVMEYLTSGITANFDMYFYPETIARASVETGFRTVLVSGLNNFVSSPEQVEREYEALNAYDDLISYRLGFHAEYTCSEEILQAVAELARKYKAPVSMHLAETEKETRECADRHGGMTPAHYLDSLGMFDYGGAAFHGIYLDDKEIEMFRERGVYVVTNPASNAKLASGICRTADLLEAGVGMAIGTDGPASNNCLDFFREMFLVTGLAKLRGMDAAAVPAYEVLKMATVGGARAMGLDDCDVLAPGKKADLVMIDLFQPNMQPMHDPVKNLVYSGSKQNVKMTMVGGRVLYEDGQFDIGTAPEEIYARTGEMIRRDFID